MDILDFDDGRYDDKGDEIVKEALRYYLKYNDWDHLEREFKNKIDESRDWTDEEVHECVEYIRSLTKKAQDSSNGIYLKGDEWFSTSISELRFWNYYKKTMKAEKWSKERIDTMTRQCSEIVNFLPNPKRKLQPNDDIKKFRRKGLVYGNVQAGKTGSIAGLISMYASAGCQLIIVLSGVTNNLRWQTQQRLIKDLKIGIEPYWHLLTPEKDRIGKGQAYVESLLAGNDVSIGVFKKNPYALRSLIKYCKKTSDDEVWKNNQVLIIDDECDQYSPNVKCIDEDDGSEYPHSTINGLIVDLLKLFPRVCYVGYTATPFANVLNEPPSDESIYPEDFIYALEKNKSYYGAEKIFGNEDDDEPMTLNVINSVPDEESIALRKELVEEIPDTLADAIDYFIIATACKYKRNLTSHSSMLIHVDLKTDVHSMIESLVENYLNQLRKEFYNNPAVFDAKIKKTWNTEKNRNPASLICELFPGSKAENYYIPVYEDLREEIQMVMQKLEIIVDNSTRPAEQRLSYDDDNPGVYIVIGGNTLSRGLTLEGLLVSYFARPSKTYDTLLQMGRWFGYRFGYEDLPRIWMPDSLVNDFRFLSAVEEEIREEIQDYSFEMTPKDFALRIRTHPRMQITRALAMQYAEVSGVNYGGTKAETLFLEKEDKKIIQSNIAATRNLLEGLPLKPRSYHNTYLYENCDVRHILKFINEYNFSERNKDCKAEPLTKYINKALEKNYLRKWNIMVKSNVEGVPMELAEGVTCNLLSRARVNENIENSSVYMRLHEPRDFKIDVDDDKWKDKDTVKLALQFKVRQEYFQNRGEEVPGLLIIYPINKDSTPKNPDNPNFLPLKAKENLIGLMFVFPIIKERSLYEYMQIPLQNEYEEEEFI